MHDATRSADSRQGIHPAARIFPMLDGPAYEALKADIEKNGLREPLVYYAGQLLDGRNRQRACKELGIEPMESELDEDVDPVAYVLSVNLHRRQLKTSQKAMCAAKLAGLPVGRPDNSANLQNLTTEDSARLFSVGCRSVSTALEVLRGGSNYLIEQCELGTISISLAAKLIDVVPDKKQHTKIAKQGREAIKAAVSPGEEVDDDQPPAAGFPAFVVETGGLVSRFRQSASPTELREMADHLHELADSLAVRADCREPRPCPNCGATEEDEYGDCAKCRDPKTPLEDEAA